MPVIWLIDAYRAGERGQVRALVEALVDDMAWPAETRTLSYRSERFLPHLLGWDSIRGLTPEAAAEAILRVANSKMAGAIRLVSIASIRVWPQS